MAVPFYSVTFGLRPDLQKLTKLVSKLNVWILSLPANHRIKFWSMEGCLLSYQIAEDPVTGNANGPLGAYLVHFNVTQDEDAPCFDFDIFTGRSD